MFLTRSKESEEKGMVEYNLVFLGHKIDVPKMQWLTASIQKLMCHIHFVNCFQFLCHEYLGLSSFLFIDSSMLGDPKE